MWRGRRLACAHTDPHTRCHCIANSNANSGAVANSSSFVHDGI